MATKKEETFFKFKKDMLDIYKKTNIMRRELSDANGCLKDEYCEIFKMMYEFKVQLTEKLWRMECAYKYPKEDKQ